MIKNTKFVFFIPQILYLWLRCPIILTIFKYFEALMNGIPAESDDWVGGFTGLVFE